MKVLEQKYLGNHILIFCSLFVSFLFFYLVTAPFFPRKEDLNWEE